MAMKPGWISYAGGRGGTSFVGPSQEAPWTTTVEYLGKYFKQCRRKRHESMNDYITRKGEAYARACQTLHRVSSRCAAGQAQESEVPPQLIGVDSSMSDQQGRTLACLGDPSHRRMRVMRSLFMMQKSHGITMTHEALMIGIMALGDNLIPKTKNAQDLNLGVRRTRVRLGEGPSFGFGNSSSDRCMSTAWLNVQAGGRGGELNVHTLDRGSSPILFSIETLRSLGAPIDFEHGLLDFESLTPTRVIHLERSCTGHQLLPLCDDWYSQATKATSPVPSLDQYI